MGVPESGYSLKRCVAINATVPVPEGWFYREDFEAGTRAYFVTLEEIRGSGMYQTGLALNAISRISRQRTLPSLMAERLITDARPGFTPMTEPRMVMSGPLVTYSRVFDFAGGVIEDKLIDPSVYYYSATGNDQRDIFYMALFETPTTRWEEFQDMEHVLIDNIVYDPRVR